MVAEIRWKSGVADGKSEPTVTAVSVPLTEMTAVPGVGWPPPDEPVDPDEPEPDVPPEGEPEGEPGAGSAVLATVVDWSTCCWNGSLLSKRLKDASWPSAAVPSALIEL